MIEILNRIPISAKVITVGCDDLKDSVVNGEEGDIEGAATKFEHGHSSSSCQLLAPPWKA